MLIRETLNWAKRTKNSTTACIQGEQNKHNDMCLEYDLVAEI